MRRKSLLYKGLILATLLSVLNWAALTFYLYWPKNGIFGFDTFMHFFGGLTLGVLVCWLLKVERRSLGSFLMMFGVVVLLGGVWEIFEYVYDITGISSDLYLRDTTHDFVMDGLGAIVAYWWATKPTSQTQQLS